MNADVILRDARREDVPAIVRMLADDALGAARESLGEPLPQAYLDAFEAMRANPDNRLLVAEQEGAIVATMQLVFIPGLSHRGTTRAVIEAVRVEAARRGQGLGREIVRQALAIARERGARMVELTSHKSRVDAHRFYEKLGFAKSHVGMKLTLDAGHERSTAKPQREGAPP